MAAQYFGPCAGPQDDRRRQPGPKRDRTTFARAQILFRTIHGKLRARFAPRVPPLPCTVQGLSRSPRRRPTIDSPLLRRIQVLQRKRAEPLPPPCGRFPAFPQDYFRARQRGKPALRSSPVRWPVCWEQRRNLRSYRVPRPLSHRGQSRVDMRTLRCSTPELVRFQYQLGSIRQCFHLSSSPPCTSRIHAFARMRDDTMPIYVRAQSPRCRQTAE